MTNRWLLCEQNRDRVENAELKREAQALMKSCLQGDNEHLLCEERIEDMKLHKLELLAENGWVHIRYEILDRYIAIC
jgi:hypothetical protein